MWPTCPICAACWGAAGGNGVYGSSASAGSGCWCGLSAHNQCWCPGNWSPNPGRDTGLRTREMVKNLPPKAGVPAPPVPDAAPTGSASATEVPQASGKSSLATGLECAPAARAGSSIGSGKYSVTPVTMMPVARQPRLCYTSEHYAPSGGRLAQLVRAHSSHG